MQPVILKTKEKFLYLLFLFVHVIPSRLRPLLFPLIPAPNPRVLFPLIPYPRKLRPGQPVLSHDLVRPRRLANLLARQKLLHDRLDVEYRCAVDGVQLGD